VSYKELGIKAPRTKAFFLPRSVKGAKRDIDPANPEEEYKWKKNSQT
jgi:hypothetical protein